MQKNTLAIIGIISVIIITAVIIYFIDQKNKREDAKTEKKTVTSTKSELPIKDIIGIFTGGLV